MEESTSKRTKKVAKPYRMYLIAALGLLVVLGGAYFGWAAYQASQNTPEALAAKQESKKQDLLAKAGKVMVLPEEEATMLEVNNADQLKSQQAFFKDVQNGDVLFIFPKALKAIIYREDGNLIVNSGPLQTEAAPQGGAAGTVETGAQGGGIAE